MKKIKDFLTKYHVMFFITLIMSIYFLVTEILNFIENKSAISMFTIILYLSSIIYVSLMEFFEWKQLDATYSYRFTFYYLLINAIMLPFTVLFGNLTDNLNPFYTLGSFFQNNMIVTITLILYFVYLGFKFIKPIVKAIKAKGKKDHFARCSNFGDIISGLLTLITSFFGVVTITSARYMEIMLLSVRTMPFIIASIAVWIVTLIFIIKCGLGILRVKKEQKEMQQ